MADFYSNHIIYEIDIKKSMKYFLKSIQIQRTFFQQLNIIKISYSYRFEPNNYRYISYNDLGLIYLIDLEDKEKAEEYIKESAFAEYPFGQNNFGLFSQIYLNKKENAEFMYKRSSKHKFSLAEFNLAHMLEEDNKIEHENEPLIYSNIKRFDLRFEISKTFIICFTNLKLVEYYFSLSNYFEFNEYFIKSINQFKKKKFIDIMKEISSYKFKIIIPYLLKNEYSGNLFSGIK